MNPIEDALEDFVLLNHFENWIPAQTILQMLDRNHQDVIPGLMDCLDHNDVEVCRLAVELLCEAIPRSHVAVPSLIERLHDDDRLVRIAVLTHIADFGEHAVGAIPHLEQWLDDDHEFLRVLAQTAIALLDPNRRELVPDIKSALHSDDYTVRTVAREYFGNTNATMPFDDAAFEQVVRGHWLNRTLCERVRWRADLIDDTWQIEIAPIFQEVWGGEDDGKRVWSAFEYDLAGLFHEPGLRVDKFATRSQCVFDSPTPFIAIKGEYFGEPFVLRMHLEPIPNSEVVELVDAIRNEVRLIESPDEDDDSVPF